MITIWQPLWAGPGTFPNNVHIENAAPNLTFRENDQTLPAGLWRTRLDGGNWQLQRNTAAAGDFSTLQSVLQFAADGTATFANTVTASITGNAGTVTNGVYTTGAQSIAGVKTFTDNPRIENAAPTLIFRENDQTLPAGLWRTMADGGNWQLQRNTAAAGDFSTLQNALQFAADGAATLGGAMAVTGDHARPLTMQRSTVAVTAPGVGNAALRWEAGTNAGTLRLVAYSGTSTVGVVIIDNVGGGN